MCDALFVVPEYEMRLHLFYNQIKHCKLLSEDIAHYLRAKFRREPDGCLSYLVDSVERILDQARQDSMREGFSVGLTPEDRKFPGTPGPTTGGAKGNNDKSKTFCIFFKGGHCKRAMIVITPTIR